MSSFEMRLKIRRAEIPASSSSVSVWLGVVMTDAGGSVGTVVRKLHVNAEVFVLQLRNDVLERIAIATGHSDNITLNRGLDPGFTVFDELYNFFGLFLRNALLDLRALPDRASGGRFD